MESCTFQLTALTIILWTRFDGVRRVLLATGYGGTKNLWRTLMSVTLM
jgi:hypothetical protein